MELSIFKDRERHLAGPRCQLGMPEAAQAQGNPEPPTERGPWRVVGASGPEPFWHQGLVSWKTVFPRTGWGGAGDDLGMIQVCYIDCVLYHYYISSTSDHQALDPGGWEPLIWAISHTWDSRRRGQGYDCIYVPPGLGLHCSFCLFIFHSISYGPSQTSMSKEVT